MCKNCLNKLDRERYQLNAVDIRIKKLEYWRKCMAINPEKVRERQRKYFIENPHKRASAEYFAKYYLKLDDKSKDKRNKISEIWRQKNPDKHCATQNKRRAKKLKATPCWADDSAIKLLFLNALTLTKETKVKHHVDHIVPLQSSIVCGLHVQGNLQVLKASENLSKSNRYWPDMP